MKVTVVKSPGGLDNLEILERKTLIPAADEVVVRWHATSLNFHDYLVATGGIPVRNNTVPMSDGAGEIIAVGENADDWQIGDKVMSLFFPNWIDGKASLKKMMFISGETIDGYIAEQSVVKAQSLTKIPTDYTFAEAATLPCAALTAWRALMVEGNLQAGESVLIEGTGGMSIFALQLAKMAGAKIYATTSSDEKAERLKSLGVEAVVNYKTDEKWGKTINRMTKGGVDHVLDVGGGSTMRQSIEAVAIGGNIASIGILGNGRKGEITFPKLFFKQCHLNGLAVGSRIMQQQMVKAIEISAMKPIVDKSFSFDQLGNAFRHQASGKHFGKIVLEW